MGIDRLFASRGHAEKQARGARVDAVLHVHWEKEGGLQRRGKKKKIKPSRYNSNLLCLTFSRHGAQAALQMLIKTGALP